MVTQLAGKVALVTGGGGGIGRSTSELLHQRGASVAIVDIDGTAAERLASELSDAGGRAEAIELDLADLGGVRTLVDEVVAQFGRLDIVVNNAAVMSGGAWLDLSESHWTRSLVVNMTAPFLLVQAFARHVAMREPGGKVVNVLSGSAFRAMGTAGPD